MTYRPAVDLFVPPMPLDAASAALFVGLFVGAVLLTSRRAAYGLGLLVLLAPFALYRELAGTTVTLPKVALLGVLVGLTTYAGNAARLRSSPMPLLAGAFGFYAVATALSTIPAAAPSAALRETLKAIEYLAFFTAAYVCYRIDPDDGIAVSATAAAGLLVGLSALAQEVAGAPSVLCLGHAIVPRIAGTLEGPNQLAGYAEIAVAALGAWSLRRRTFLVDAALATLTCAAVLTFSRAGLGALLVVGIVLAIAGGRHAAGKLRYGIAGVVVGLLGAGAWAFAAHAGNVLRLSFASSACTGGVGNRHELWPAAWHMWLRHPWLGVGAGNFQLDLPLYGVPGVRTQANSWFLQSLAEGGIVLFCATVALIATILGTCGARLAAWLRAREAAQHPWVVAAFAATAALALHQVVDDLVFYPKVGVAWVLLVGIAAAALAARRDGRAAT